MRKLLPGLSALGLFMLVCPLFSLAQEGLDTFSIRQLVYKNASRLHITAEDAGNAIISDTYLEKETGIQYVYLQQVYRQVPVFNSLLSLSFKNNSLVYASGKFVGDMAAKAGSPT